MLVGHSFGGLFVQQLLDRGIGRAGVAIHPAPGRGVLPNPAAFKASQGVLKVWRFWKRVLTMSRTDFDRFFANGLPEAEQQVEYETQVIPTPGRIFFQAATASFHRATEVSYDNPTRPPLLLMAGSEDRTVPASLIRATFRRHQKSAAVTELVEFPGRSHYTIREPGWEQVADRSREWWEGVLDRGV